MHTDSTRSEAQQQASRSNGAQGHGPTTEAGKQRSSQNARRHDFFTKIHLLPGEDQEEFYAILHAFTTDHNPQNATERFYVHEMADAAFRLGRVRRHAADIQSKAAEDMSDAFEKLAEDGKSLQLCLRYERHFQRQFDNAIKMILTLRKQTNQTSQSEQLKELTFHVKTIHRAVFGPPQPGEDPVYDDLFKHAQEWVAAQRNEPALGL